MAHTYSEAGVDIEAGDEFVRRIKGKVRSTFTSSVLADIGAFGAFYDGKFKGVRHPVIVSSVDGVGTKLKVAFLTGRHSTIGQDLVNHCVNDIAVCGARPLFFLDYLAAGKLIPRVMEEIIDGMVRACRENSCSLVGGETAEMPGFYGEGEYDIAGMIVGIADRKKMFDGKKVRAGDQLIALPSTGLHTNGYSLARAVLFDRFRVEEVVDELGMSVGDALLAVHRSYLAAIKTLASTEGVHAFAHITGGGIVGNTSRVIPGKLKLDIDWERWRRPAIFELIQSTGSVPEEDMRRTFNLGVGLVIIAAKESVDRIMKRLQKDGEKPFLIGSVVRKTP